MLVHTVLSDTLTPVALFHQLAAHQPYAFLLDSAEADTRLARYSFIGWQPHLVVRFWQKQRTATVLDCRSGQQKHHVIENPLTLLHQLQQQHYPASCQPMPGTHPALAELPFTGGWVGVLGYGSMAYFEAIPQQPNDPLQVPDGCYALYPTLVAIDHLKRRIHLLSNEPEQSANQAVEQLQDALRGVGQTLPPLLLPDDAAAFPTVDTLFQPVQAALSQSHYEAGVQACQQLIQQGEAFQMVLANRYTRPYCGDPLTVYRLLMAVNPSPYAYYLKLDDHVYLGSSPETFVGCRQGQVHLKALAGTRHRAGTAEADEALATELRQHPKELAEHKMLVDLGRNDLGKVCLPGTVRIGELAEVVRYTHVMHLATEVRGTLKPGLTGYDVVRACFPRGTVSGAPKIRAMQHLAQLEPERRGYYAGTVGYFDWHGDTDGCIALRSVLLKDGLAHVHAGAGVVMDSVPGAEYEETRNKAASVMLALALADGLQQPVAEKGTTLR